MTALDIQSLTFSHASKPVLRDVTLSLDGGQYGVLLGGSGSGKTTILRLIAGLLKPNSGRVLLDGIDQAPTPPHLRGVSMVFQNDTLYPHWTIRQTLAHSARHLRSRGDRIESIASLLGITDWLDRPPREVSGGELRRAALANALVARPAIVLLDEPLSALDGAVRHRLIDGLAQLPRDRDDDLPPTSILHVTHDGDEAMRLADKIFVLSGGEIVQAGSPIEVYQTPSTASAALALGHPPANLVTIDDGLVLIRPEAIRLADDTTEGSRFDAEIVAFHFAGSHAHVVLKSNRFPQTLTASMSWSVAGAVPPLGSIVQCVVAPEDCRLVADDRSDTIRG